MIGSEAGSPPFEHPLEHVPGPVEVTHRGKRLPEVVQFRHPLWMVVRQGNLAMFLPDVGRARGALPPAEQVLAVAEHALPSGHEELQIARLALARVSTRLAQRGDLDGARERMRPIRVVIVLVGTVGVAIGAQVTGRLRAWATQRRMRDETVDGQPRWSAHDWAGWSLSVAPARI